MARPTGRILQDFENSPLGGGGKALQGALPAHEPPKDYVPLHDEVKSMMKEAEWGTREDKPEPTGENIYARTLDVLTPTSVKQREQRIAAEAEADESARAQVRARERAEEVKAKRATMTSEERMVGLIASLGDMPEDQRNAIPYSASFKKLPAEKQVDFLNALDVANGVVEQPESEPVDEVFEEDEDSDEWNDIEYVTN